MLIVFCYIWTCPETVDSQDEKIVFSKGRFTWA